MNVSTLSRAALAVFIVGCAGTQHAVQQNDAPAAQTDAPPAPPPNNDAPAPLDPEIAALPGARASWMIDQEYGAVYVVTVGPERAPTAPTLVMVHGLGTNGVRDFYPVLAPLAVHRRVVLFDLPGFGRSGRANVKYAPDRYAGTTV